jgi:spectinomycin phosphotransferase
VITENPDISLDVLRDVVQHNWDVTVTELSFLPVGGDSWSYRAGDLFINLREALGQRKPWTFPRDVERSLVAAVALKERCGLDFMLTPLPTTTGRTLARLGAYAVTLFPYIDGSPSYDERAEVTCDEQTVSWIERLHAATPAIEDLELPSEDFRPDFAAALRTVLDRARSETLEGPYAERVRALLTSSRDLVLDTLLRHEAHGATLRVTPMEFVVTHGEPAGNVLLARDGRRYLVDLVQLKRGPRERDLHDYPVEARDASADHDVITYYKRGFALSEVTEYADRLTRPHLGDDEDDRAWRYLGEYIEELRSF